MYQKEPTDRMRIKTLSCKELTFISESFFHLSNLDFLLIRQNLGWLPIGHEFEGVGTCHHEAKKSNTNVADHDECIGVVQVGRMSAMLWVRSMFYAFALCSLLKLKNEMMG